jgi:hypothetical protein
MGTQRIGYLIITTHVVKSVVPYTQIAFSIVFSAHTGKSLITNTLMTLCVRIIRSKTTDYRGLRPKIGVSVSWMLELSPLSQILPESAGIRASKRLSQNVSGKGYWAKLHFEACPTMYRNPNNIVGPFALFHSIIYTLVLVLNIGTHSQTY